MKELAIYGAGGFGKEVAMLVEQINAAASTWKLIGFFDDGLPKNTVVNGYICLGGVDELNRLNQNIGIVLAIGDPRIKIKIWSRINNLYIYYPSLIHPNVQMGAKDYVTIGEGCIITAGNLITVNIIIGKHVILNLACTVGHDVFVDDFSSLMPGVNISGGVQIATGVFIGTGAKIINHLKIGENAIIGAGAVVIKSIPANCTAVGVPAKPIKYH
jgi:sugar O-acyltransferase (sialic acid O-acetyltransferase NeuD family)